MKKLLSLAVLLTVGFGFKNAYATCASTDIMCNKVGGTQKWKVSKDGNVTAAGTLTVDGASTHTGAVTNSSNVTTLGKTIYTPTSQVTVATNVPVGITATYMVLKSTALIVTYQQVGRVSSDGPAITTATATSGQYLVLGSTTSVDTVVITTGTATAVLSGSDATITISAAKPAMAFIYNSTLSAWIAVGKQ